MRALTVLYDTTCDLCRSARVWLEGQPKYVPLTFIPAGSPLAKRRFPEIDAASTLRDLTVIDDQGAVYRGAKAWLMCLWALRDYREQALRLASPTVMPAARRFISMVSRNRRRLGVLGLLLERSP
jgi:predicted DCC family thiol-disulfide oxidoreductase YuxK